MNEQEIKEAFAQAIQQAQDLILAEEYDEAETVLQGLAGILPNHQGVQGLFALLYFQTGKWERCQLYIDRALKHDVPAINKLVLGLRSRMLNSTHSTEGITAAFKKYNRRFYEQGWTTETDAYYSYKEAREAKSASELWNFHLVAVKGVGRQPGIQSEESTSDPILSGLVADLLPFGQAGLDAVVSAATTGRLLNGDYAFMLNGAFFGPVMLEAIGEFGDLAKQPVYLDVLESNLDSDDPLVRRYARRAIERLEQH